MTAYYRKQPTCVDDASIAGVREIPNNTTISALKALGATLNFIIFWIKQFHHNYQEMLEMYHEAMIKLFKQIPNIKSKPLIQDKKLQFLLTYIGGTWYMKK